MKKVQWNTLSKEELIAKEKSLKEELFKLNQQRYAGRVEKPHQFSLIRRDLARIQAFLGVQQAAGTSKGK